MSSNCLLSLASTSSSLFRYRHHQSRYLHSNLTKMFTHPIVLASWLCRKLFQTRPFQKPPPRSSGVCHWDHQRASPGTRCRRSCWRSSWWRRGRTCRACWGPPWPWARTRGCGAAAGTLHSAALNTRPTKSNGILNVKMLVGAFNHEKALVGAL